MSTLNHPTAGNNIIYVPNTHLYVQNIYQNITANNNNIIDGVWPVSGNTKIIAITCDGSQDYQNTRFHNTLKTKLSSASYPDESEKGNFLLQLLVIALRILLISLRVHAILK